MRVRGNRKLLLLAIVATVIVAPLGALAWQVNGSDSQSLVNHTNDQNQSQPPSTPQNDSPKNLAETPTSSAPVGGNSSKTTITINDRQISLSPDGHAHQVIQNASGTTTLDVSVSNNVSGNAASSQSSNSVNLYSSSVTSVGGQRASN